MSHQRAPRPPPLPPNHSGSALPLVPDRVRLVPDIGRRDARIKRGNDDRRSRRRKFREHSI